MKAKTYTLGFVIVALTALSFYNLLLKKNIQDRNLNAALELKDIYGNEITGYEHKKYIIVNFWATWCPPCVEETPSLMRFAEKNKDDFFLVALSQDDSKKEIFSFIKTFPGLTNSFIHIVHDSSQAIARAFKVDKLPETFIYSIDKNKFIQFSGSTNWDSPDVLVQINKSF